MSSNTPRLEKGGLIETGPLSSGSGGGLSRRRARLTLVLAGRCHRLCRLFSFHLGSCQSGVPWVRCSLVSACSYPFCHIWACTPQLTCSYLFFHQWVCSYLTTSDFLHACPCTFSLSFCRPQFLYRADHCSCPLTLWVALPAPNSLFLIPSWGPFSSTVF